MKKRFFSTLLTIILVFNFSVSAYAEVPPTYQKTKEYLWQIVQDIGFIGTLPFKGIIEIVNEIKHAKGIVGEDVSTDQEALDYAFDGISINGDGNVVLNDNAKLNINYLIDNYKNDFGYYPVYGCSFQASTEYFGSNILAISKLLDGSNFVQIGTYFASYPNGAVYVYEYDSNDQLVVVKSSDYDDNWKYGTVYRILDNGIVKTVEPFFANQGECSVYRAPNAESIVNETQNMTFPMIDAYGNSYFQAYFSRKPNQSCGANDWNRGPKTFSTSGNSMLMFNSVEAVHAYLEDVGMGHYPYYVNNPIYDSFNTSSGDYVIDSNNRNTVTYGDVNTYIDDHHTETGTFPTMPEINIFIESGDEPTPTTNPDNPSGGSSGGATATANNEGINININNNHNINVGIPSLSGNTVSGNGSGSSGGIFDWISSIGGVIGDFIKNVGQLIADVIKGISETITTVLSTLPNLLSGIVEFVYGGLPDELKALVTLGLTAVVLVSVIKILRK